MVPWIQREAVTVTHSRVWGNGKDVEAKSIALDRRDKQLLSNSHLLRKGHLLVLLPFTFGVPDSCSTHQEATIYPRE
ncbi:hypothetical protein I79_007467 [Cricetulus griseus]|uniref:Uncharacterized protein n=1 Tax=Cricetulus griseus TaxID=10029 RepID=G3HAK8_CRIGR|nr:hypothetical protein I79_007467 [Cricetulus griseus]ERE85886.1 hypothetical protein H671_2g4895 [Cricetulus griseus]